MEHLIPDAAFVAMPLFMLSMVALGSMWALIRGADLLVDNAAGLAVRLGMPPVLVGATIVSLGTTSPETAVSVMAAWGGNSGLALGNAVGSIIADTGFIFGLGCLLAVLPADRFVLLRQGVVKLCTDLLLIVLCYGAWLWRGDEAAITRPMGWFLLALLVGYLWLSVRWARQHPFGEPHDEVETGEHTAKVKNKPAVLLWLALLGGLVVVIIASRFLVASATVIAQQMGVPQVVIASTLVAMGTSLPELTVGVTAILKGHRELLVGNVIGADILNVLFVTGAAAAAKPLQIVDPTAAIPELFLYLHLPTMLVIGILFAGFIMISARRGEFRRWYGVPLMVIYVAYIGLQYWLGASPGH